MDTTTFAVYAAGFFDGEGWVRIGLEHGKSGNSDIHHLSVYVTQRARYRAVLDQFQEAFGGLVTVRDTKLKDRETWAEQADWHIHARPDIERFCRAVQPYCIVKARQIAIALEYVTGFEVSPNLRDDLGRVHGRALSAEEVARRERLRLALHEANVRGSERTTKIERPRRSAVRVPRAQPTVSDPATIKRGEGHYKAILTEDAVRVIHAELAAGTTRKAELARRYGVSWSAINLIGKGKTWKHVT
jgi:hypothetical protein